MVWYKNNAGFIKPWVLLIGMIIFCSGYQYGMMWLWYHISGVHDFMLRFSLSNSDAVAIYCTAIAFVGYNIAATSSQSDDAMAIRDLAIILRPVIKRFTDLPEPKRAKVQKELERRVQEQIDEILGEKSETQIPLPRGRVNNEATT